MDYSERRRMMVDTQVRPSDVTKFPIIEAMLTVPRERFVPEAWREAAYAGENVELAPGRVVFEPRTIAKMLDAVNIRADETVLDIACGLGYSTALAAMLGDAVVAVEEDPDFAREAEANLSEQGADNAVVIEAPLVDGAPKHGPYDVILIQGGVERVPEALVAQLAEGGRMACLFREGALGVVRLGIKNEGRIDWRFLFNAGAPHLRGFEAAKAFSL